MKTLRLLLWTDCPKRCSKCCNKSYDIEKLPILETFEGWDAICFTGGEPMLFPSRIQDIAIQAAHENPNAKRYLYTAMPSLALVATIGLFHGVTVSVQNLSDFEQFRLFDSYHLSIKNFSYVLKLLDYAPGPLPVRISSRWKVRTATWQEHCPLPENETFMRLADCIPVGEGARYATYCEPVSDSLEVIGTAGTKSIEGCNSPGSD